MHTSNKDHDETLAEGRDKALKEQILNMVRAEKSIHEIMQLILLDRERAVREARIDELKHIVSGSEYSDNDFSWYEKTREEYSGTQYYSEIKSLTKDERIAQLSNPTQEKK